MVQEGLFGLVAVSWGSVRILRMQEGLLGLTRSTRKVMHRQL